MAHKDGKWILVEVKDMDQLHRYSEAAEELGSELLLVFKFSFKFSFASMRLRLSTGVLVNQASNSIL